MSEPRTEAGRRLYEAMQSAAVGVEPPFFPLPKLPQKGWPYRDAILAIEDEVERLALERLREAHDNVCACPFDGTDEGCNFAGTTQTSRRI